MEYVTRILSGYSHACKWCMLHPDKVLDIMTKDINQALQTQKRSLLREKLKVAVAISTSKEVKNNGFCYFNEKTTQDSLDNYGAALLDDPSKLESAKKLITTEPLKNADLATFSSDEWKQVTKFTGKWLDYYQ
ncbi:MAG TPA: hypothetical protein VE134_07835 [Methanomicrobiales archaeon]|nr:hypothetical protein [Methanomicrobiales archaeon]